jgi:hypothetical protein
MSQGGDGRDHNPHGFTMWFAGGGVKPGTIVGETDEMDLGGVDDRYSMRDFPCDRAAPVGPRSESLAQWPKREAHGRRWHGDQTDAGYGFVQFAQIGRVSPLERLKFVQFAQIPPPSTIDTV